jgi:hypothetical protein
MRFAARESAIFAQPEPGFGVVPGGGGVQHLTRLMGRGRALEVMLSAQDYDAALAERYGWINRALPAKELDDFVSALAHRIAQFPAAGLVAVKQRVNAIALAPVEDFRRDSDLFGEASRKSDAQSLFQTAFKRGFQTREGEMDLGRLVGDLATADRVKRGPPCPPKIGHQKPADLSVEPPTKFEFVRNLKTAKGLGLSISPGIVAARRRGDRIEAKLLRRALVANGT